MMMKTCRTCGQDKPHSDFYLEGSRHHLDCKLCFNERRKMNRDKARKLGAYQVRGWAAETKLVHAGRWQAPNAWSGSHGVTRHTGKTG